MNKKTQGNKKKKKKIAGDLWINIIPEYDKIHLRFVRIVIIFHARIYNMIHVI